MSSKKRSRKVTVESDKIAVGDSSSSEKRKLSVFERLGPGAPRKHDVPEKHSAVETESPVGVCHKWQKYGTCQYGSKCRYQHSSWREHSSDEYHHHDNKASDTESELDEKSVSRDSKKDKIKSTVVVTKPSTLDESDSDPGPDCTDEDLQRRLSQLKQELSRLDQEEKERERKERAGLAQISSEDSEKDMPPVITPPTKHKKDKVAGEQSNRKKKEKKKKKKKLQKLLPHAEEDKIEKKKHHLSLEKDSPKLKQKNQEKPKPVEKPKFAEKKKAGPMIPRSVQQKVIKTRQSSSSPSQSPSQSPSSMKKKKAGPKQMKRDKVAEKRSQEGGEQKLIKSEMSSERGIKDSEHRTYSPSYRSEVKRDKGSERLPRSHREQSPRAETRDKSGDQLQRSHRELSPRGDFKDRGSDRMGRVHQEPSPLSIGRRRDLERDVTRSLSSRHSRRSVTPQSRRSHSQSQWSRRAVSRKTSSSSSSSSSNSSSSSSPSPVRAKRSPSPRRQYASPSRRSPSKRSEARSQSTSRHSRSQSAYAKGVRKGKEVELSPSKKRSTVERAVQSRDRSVPVDINKKRPITENDLRKVEDLSRHRDSSPRESQWAESPVEKARRRRSLEDDRKRLPAVDPRHDPVDVADRSDRRKLEASQSSRQRGSRDITEKRVHGSKHAEYASEYDTRAHSPQASSTRALSPTDRHRADYTQYRDGYVSTTSERDRYADRDHYDVYGRDTRDAYRRSDDRSRDTDRERDYISSTVIDPRERERYDTAYDHRHYASYVRETDRLDLRRDYSAYYDERGRLLDEATRLRTEDVRGRTTDDRSHDEYSRSYDRYRYLYECEASSSRSEVERRRDTSRDVSSDRVRSSRDWQLERSRWERDRLRDDPRLLDTDLVRSVHDPRDLVDPRDIVRDRLRDSRVDARSEVHSDIRLKAHSEIRTDPRSESRVRSESHIDVRADPRVDVRDVHIDSRSRDRSVDNRESRGQTDRDRLVDTEHKDSRRDHLSRRSEWEQRDIGERCWPGEKLKERLLPGSRKRTHEDVDTGSKSQSSKHRRESSLEKDYQKLEHPVRSVEPHEVHKSSRSRSKTSDHLQDVRSECKPSQDRKVKDVESLYPEKVRVKDYDVDAERKYDRAGHQHGKESAEREKLDRDSRSTSSRDADSKESRDSRSKERDVHAADPEQDRLYEQQRTWPAKDRDADLERDRQDRIKLRKAYDKERDKVDKDLHRSADKDKVDESCVVSSVVSSSHRSDYKRHRSHSVDSPRKRPRKKGHDIEGASDWSNPEKELLDTDRSYKRDAALSPQAPDERFSGHSPGHSSLGSKHSVHEEDREVIRKDHLPYDYDREYHARDDLVDSDRHSRSDSRYLYVDKSRDVCDAHSVDHGVSSHYADRHDERSTRDEYIRDRDVRKSDVIAADVYSRDWPTSDRIEAVDHRSRDLVRDQVLDHGLDHLEHSRVTDLVRDRSVDRLDWSSVYRDHRTDNYAESCHSYRSDRVYPDSRADIYPRDSDRLAPERIPTVELDPALDRRDSPLEHPDTRADARPAEHGYFDNQDPKRDRYLETWPTSYSASSAAIPQSQTDPTLSALPSSDTPDDKHDGETIEYDAISDGDLDDIIGPDGSSDTEEKKPQKTGIVDVLDIDWASLMKQNELKPTTAGSVLKKFTPANIFTKIGVSLQFAGEELYSKIEKLCQRQPEENDSPEQTDEVTAELKKEDVSKKVKTEPDTSSATDAAIKVESSDTTVKIETDEKPDATETDGTKPDVAAATDERKADVTKTEETKPDVMVDVKNEDLTKADGTKSDVTKADMTKAKMTKADIKKFKLLHGVAQFHVSLMAKKQEREQLLKDVGSFRRALCARRDLYMRKKLCKLDTESDSLHLYPAQVVDQELYRQSVQIFKADRPLPVVGGLNMKPMPESEAAAS